MLEMKNIIGIFICLFIIFPSFLWAQSDSDIYLIAIKSTKNSIKVNPNNEPQKINEQVGYNDQPYFVGKNKLAYSAEIDGQNDILIYDLKEKSYFNITNTPTSEYSPKLTDCEQYVSAVTVEEDGKQRLWLYPFSLGEPDLLLHRFEPIGYYDWYDNKVVGFILGNPNTLQYAYSLDEVVTLDEQIGRTIQKVKGSTTEIRYSKQVGNESVICGVNIADPKRPVKKTIGKALPGSRDFYFIDENIALMARGNVIYSRNFAENDGNWEICYEFTDNTAIITRIAVDEKKKNLAFTVSKNK